MRFKPRVTARWIRRAALRLNDERHRFGRNLRSPCWTLAAAVVVIAPLCGCGDRLNHLYHEPNHRAAEQALADFEAFAGESVGLRPTLLTNLSARAALARRVAATRNDVDDQDRVTALLGKTWTGLRSDTFREFGLSVTPQQVQDQRPSLDPIIAHRLKQLEALAEVLEALGEGQTALIRQANADIKRFSDAAKAPTPVAAGAGAGAQPEAPATDEQLTLQLVNLLV